MMKRFLEPLCKKRVQMFFYEEIWKMGRKYENYDLTDAELDNIENKFYSMLQHYNSAEQKIMKEEFEELCRFYKRKRDEINLPYS